MRGGAQWHTCPAASLHPRFGLLIKPTTSHAPNSHLLCQPSQAKDPFLQKPPATSLVPNAVTC